MFLSDDEFVILSFGLFLQQSGNFGKEGKGRGGMGREVVKPLLSGRTAALCGY